MKTLYFNAVSGKFVDGPGENVVIIRKRITRWTWSPNNFKLGMTEISRDLLG